MTDDTVLDTTIDEPPMTGGEVEMLLFALDRSRAGLNRPSLPDLIDAASAYAALLLQAEAARPTIGLAATPCRS